MVKIYKRLPSLSGLATFHAVAKLGSFSLASNSLHLTQSAISKQMKLLETQISARLFDRGARGVELTDQGRELLVCADRVLDDLERSVHRVRLLHHNGAVKIICTEAVAHFWLSPRLYDFASSYPNVRIDVVTTGEVDPSDLRDHDFAILYGHGDWSNLNQFPLFAEVVYPVAHINFSTELVHKPSDFLSLKLIQLNPERWPWMTWREWLHSFGVVHERESEIAQFSHASLAISAAINQQGVALGWDFMMETLLQNKLIKKVGDFSVTTGMTDFLVYSQNRILSPDAVSFRDWLLNNITR
ncbi:LysR substrate-binding domain-containing protein [Mesorhizobium sp. 131-2-5]|uniref:LysR substrate-binding domain-containing protein n=1 Tax=Mesorhizobium sp. 131-2-5 TaxID=2744519 RepID=UPI0018EDA358|nr:LysR substrate-binding domain-containing protein [Mesorhizobium sp. 131-2-5]